MYVTYIQTYNIFTYIKCRIPPLWKSVRFTIHITGDNQVSTIYICNNISTAEDNKKKLKWET